MVVRCHMVIRCHMVMRCPVRHMISIKYQLRHRLRCLFFEARGHYISAHQALFTLSSLLSFDPHCHRADDRGTLYMSYVGTFGCECWFLHSRIRQDLVFEFILKPGKNLLYPHTTRKNSYFHRWVRTLPIYFHRWVFSIVYYRKYT